MPFSGLQALAREQGFEADYVLDASQASDVPEGISTLLLLLYPYDSWGKADKGYVRISTYYFAAQEAYLRARNIVCKLNQMGESARLCNDVRLKPLLSRLKDFSQGRNTLHYHREYGSRFHIQVIGLDSLYPMDESILQQKNEGNNMCGSCRRCLQACPASALTEEGFRREKCLRQHMMRGAPVPAGLRPLMGNRLLGCDVCQQACPYNDSLKKRDTAEECFPVEDLINQDSGTLARLAQKIGRNMTLPNRVLSQAVIIAGNSGERAYLPVLDKLCDHPSQAVSEHAKWAVKFLSIGAGEATT